MSNSNDERLLVKCPHCDGHGMEPYPYGDEGPEPCLCCEGAGNVDPVIVAEMEEAMQVRSGWFPEDEDEYWTAIALDELETVQGVAEYRAEEAARSSQDMDALFDAESALTTELTANLPF